MSNSMMKRIINVSTKDNTVDEDLNVDYLLEDWKECRSSIKELDKIIVNLRKYGFTIITGLLSASAFLFVKISGLSTLEKAVVSFVMIVLIYALFIIDRYFSILLSSAVRRAVNIEKNRAMNLSFHISAFAEKAGVSIRGLKTYDLFIVACILPVILTSFPFNLMDGLIIITFSLTALFIWINMKEYYHHTRIDYDYEEQCERNTIAINSENAGRIDDAIKEYRKNVNERYINNYSYDRLSKIYRKQGKWRKERLVRERGREVFKDLVYEGRLDRKQKLDRFERGLKVYYIRLAIHWNNKKEIDKEIKTLKCAINYFEENEQRWLKSKNPIEVYFEIRLKNTYRRYVENYRDKRMRDKEIDLLEDAIKFFKKKRSRWRKEKDPKLRYFEKRLEEAKKLR